MRPVTALRRKQLETAIIGYTWRFDEILIMTGQQRNSQCVLSRHIHFCYPRTRYSKLLEYASWRCRTLSTLREGYLRDLRSLCSNMDTTKLNGPPRSTAAVPNCTSMMTDGPSTHVAHQPDNHACLQYTNTASRTTSIT